MLDGSGYGNGFGSGNRYGFGKGTGSQDFFGNGLGRGIVEGCGFGSGYGDGGGSGFGNGGRSGYVIVDDYRSGFGSEDWDRIEKGYCMVNFYRDGLEEQIDTKPKVYSTREGHVVEEYSVGGVKRFFVTISGSTYCAHGNTLAEAITDAIWKDEKKRPNLESLKKEINEAGRDRKITLAEFKILTGACSTGCSVALKRAGLDGSPMTSDDIEKHFPEWGKKLKKVLAQC